MGEINILTVFLVFGAVVTDIDLAEKALAASTESNQIAWWSIRIAVALFLGNLLLSFYLHNKSRKHNFLAQEFSRVRSPIEQELDHFDQIPIDVENIVKSIGLGEPNSDEASQVAVQVNEFQRNRAIPSFFALNLTLKKADESHHIIGEDWCDQLEAQWDNLLDHFGLITNAMIETPRRERALKQLAKDVRELTRSFREMLASEAARLDLGLLAHWWSKLKL